MGISSPSSDNACLALAGTVKKAFVGTTMEDLAKNEIDLIAEDISRLLDMSTTKRDGSRLRPRNQDS